MMPTKPPTTAEYKVILVLLVLVLITAIVIAMVLPSLKRKAKSVNCGNYMASIGCAAWQYADDHDGHFPSNLISMSNYCANSTKLMVCPGDPIRKPASNWTLLNSNNCSYEIVRANLTTNDTDGVFLRCKVHGHLGYNDGTVFDGVSRRTKKLLK